jgi:hypothetical protein
MLMHKKKYAFTEVRRGPSDARHHHVKEKPRPHHELPTGPPEPRTTPTQSLVHEHVRHALIRAMWTPKRNPHL